jgi:hypothetical protein
MVEMANQMFMTGGMVMATDKQPSEQPPAAVDRINVALVAEAAEALDKLQSRTGLKKVDIVNRALKLYEFIDDEVRAGNKILIRDEEGKDSLVKLIF